jgi:hypothetical protein
MKWNTDETNNKEEIIVGRKEGRARREKEPTRTLPARHVGILMFQRG